jgi:hypothetical protein
MIYFEKVGVFLKFYASDEKLVKKLNEALAKISGVYGRSMDMAKKITDDSQRFCAAGIPSITVGHSGMGMGGFHSTDDNMDRFDLKNLKLMIATLETFIEAYDN